MTEGNSLAYTHLCKQCNKPYDIFKKVNGKEICINCWLKKRREYGTRNL